MSKIQLNIKGLETAVLIRITALCLMFIQQSFAQTFFVGDATVVSGLEHLHIASVDGSEHSETSAKATVYVSDNTTVYVQPNTLVAGLEDFQITHASSPIAKEKKKPEPKSIATTTKPKPNHKHFVHPLPPSHQWGADRNQAMVCVPTVVTSKKQSKKDITSCGMSYHNKHFAINTTTSNFYTSLADYLNGNTYYIFGYLPPPSNIIPKFRVA